MRFFLRNFLAGYSLFIRAKPPLWRNDYVRLARPCGRRRLRRRSLPRRRDYPALGNERRIFTLPHFPRFPVFRRTALKAQKTTAKTVQRGLIFYPNRKPKLQKRRSVLYK